MHSIHQPEGGSDGKFQKFSTGGQAERGWAAQRRPPPARHPPAIADQPATRPIRAPAHLLSPPRDAASGPPASPAAGASGTLPRASRPAYISSLSKCAPAAAHAASRAAQESPSSVAPVGLCGKLQTTARVPPALRAARQSLTSNLGRPVGWEEEEEGEGCPPPAPSPYRASQRTTSHPRDAATSVSPWYDGHVTITRSPGRSTALAHR